MQLKLAFILTLALISGCSTQMIDSINKATGIGVVSEDYSSFDDSRIVNVSPSWLYDTNDGVRTVKLGASWKSVTPDLVALVMKHDSSVDRSGLSNEVYLNITSIDIRVNGDTRSFRTGRTDHDSGSYNSISNTISTSSEARAVIPMDLLMEMLSAEDCRVRVYTNEGYEDAVFHIERMPGGQATAKVALQEFVAAIEESST